MAVEKETGYIPMVDGETKKRIAKNLRALEEGKYIEVDPTDKQALKVAQKRAAA